MIIRQKKFFILTFIIFVLCACTTMKSVNKYGLKGYITAENEIASLAEQYEMSYQNASKIAQENWKRDIDPLFFKAEDILNEWKVALDLNIDTQNNYEKYVEIRGLILKYLVKIQEG